MKRIFNVLNLIQTALISLELFSVLKTGGGQNIDIACDVDIYPSTFGNPTPVFDGSFEKTQPLADGIISNLASGHFPLGCICKRGFIGPLSGKDAVYNTTANSQLFPPTLNNQDCLTRCQDMETEVGFLPGSDSFFANMLFVPGRTFSLQYFIFGESFSVERPTLQFYTALVTDNPLNVVIMLGFASDNFILNVASVNGTDCGSTKWAKFSISADVLLNKTEFLSREERLSGSFLAILVENTPDVKVAIDNVEFVGPPSTNPELIDVLGFAKVQQSFPEFEEASVFGTDILDQFVSILVFVLFALAFAILFIVLRNKALRTNIFVTRFTLVWALVSTFVSFYAIFQYLGFLGQAEALENQLENTTEELLSLVQEISFDFRQLETATNGAGAYNVVSRPLPRASREALEKVFIFRDDDVEECERSRISVGNCSSTANEFFQETFYNTSTININDLESRETYVVEAAVTASQDHFVTLLLASLIGDVVASFIFVITALLSSRLLSVKRAVIGFESLFTLVNFILVLYLFAIALSEPVQYRVAGVLVDSATGLGVSIALKSELLTTNAAGELQLDSSGLGTYTRCFEPVGSTPPLDAFGFLIQSLGITLLQETSPRTVGTDLETCDWGNVVSDVLPDGDICMNLDCTDGVIGLVRSNSVQPLLNFVTSQIIYAVVVIDLVISTCDIAVWLINFAMFLDITREEVEPTQIKSDC